MKYIFLIAGKGVRLHPLTLKQPKSMFKLDKDTTVLKRMISLVRKYDRTAEIVAVVGFMHQSIEKELDGITFIRNPFYEVTNSSASLWFAREHLHSDNITIINGDVVMEETLVRDVLCHNVEKPMVLFDSTIRSQGDYNVQITGEKVLVMSKELEEYDGEYAGVTKLDKESAQKLYRCIEEMIEDGLYNQWYENALVQMIFNEDFELYYKDICNYKWTEVDCVDDMLLAKQIHLSEMK